MVLMNLKQDSPFLQLKKNHKMKLIGIESKYAEIIRFFQEDKTAIIKIFNRFYLVNSDGFFLPHGYQGDGKFLADYSYANTHGYSSHNSHFDEFTLFSENLYKINFNKRATRSDFVWHETYQGILHSSGRRFFYEIEDHEGNCESKLVEYKNYFEVTIYTTFEKDKDNSFIKMFFRRSDLVHVLTLYFNWCTYSKLLETNNLKQKVIKLDSNFRMYREHFDIEKNVQKGV